MKKLKLLFYSLTAIFIFTVLMFSTPQYTFSYYPDRAEPPPKQEIKKENELKKKIKKKVKKKKRKKRKIVFKGKNKNQKEMWNKIINIISTRNHSGFLQDGDKTISFVSTGKYDLSITKEKDKYYISFYDKNKNIEHLQEIHNNISGEYKKLSKKKSVSRSMYPEHIFDNFILKNKYDNLYEISSPSSGKLCRFNGSNFFKNKKYQNKTRLLAYGLNDKINNIQFGIDDYNKEITQDSFIIYLSYFNGPLNIILRPCDDSYMDKRVVEYFTKSKDIDKLKLGIENVIFDCKRNENRWKKSVYLNN